MKKKKYPERAQQMVGSINKLAHLVFYNDATKPIEKQQERWLYVFELVDQIEREWAFGF